jgi:DNA polymerase-3 subunit alpha
MIDSLERIHESNVSDEAGANFVHLHLHTEYSLLDGAIRLRDLPSRLEQLGMKACAMTDHGVLFGAIDFYTEMIKHNIKPIIGSEVYVAPRRHTDKEAGMDKEPAHLVLLAENDNGYRNLIKLVSAGFTDGFYYKPRIDHQLMEQYHEGIIALSACLGGEIPQAILDGNIEEAIRLAKYYDDVFGRGNFYLELQSNGIEEQNLVNSSLIRISRETGIPLVATNDCHYLMPEDATAHEVLLCMQTGKRMSDPDRMRMNSSEFYLKSGEEMARAFASVPEAIANTALIAERCNVTFRFDQLHLPSFDVPDGLDHETYLYQLCRAGLTERLVVSGSDIPVSEYERRLEYELSVINSMGYTDYYLIVWDFIRFARENDIMVGPGRGSGAGSVAAWCLHITDIDPLKYKLIFERFLNAERVSMPDFDIDFCYERRPEVMNYVVEKYGQDRVAQVITFGTLAARACIRDVGRALDVSYADTDRIARMVPTTLGITLKKALDVNPELRKDYEENEITKQVIDLAMKFEGMPRHASTHAAGVVISSQPLTELAPLSRNEDAIVVQFAKNNIEKVGLLKFDFLGLRTLTVMRETADLVLASGGPEIDFEKILMDDDNIYRMISDGNTDGIFQLESPGMTSFMKELKPESLEDIIAGISLYRPGPMEQIPRYVQARHDPGKIRYDHPLLEPILNVTYGCIVYQEQVMQIVRDLAGFSMGQSDNVRRAMSKKKPDELARYRKLFIHGGEDEKGRKVPGAIAHGVSLAIAEKIFDDVMAFAGYAFNKSHAAAYAVVAYYTAWLKYYHPVEFMAAMLNSYLGNLSQAANYVNACRRMGIEVLPPDINRSYARFTPENGAIRFSLAAVKNVGGGAIRQLIELRSESGAFASFGDFLRRVSDSDMNKKMIESLIRSSALDCFGIPRVKMIAASEPFLNQLASARRNSMEGQLSLFEMDGAEAGADQAEPVYPDLREFSHMELLTMEREMLGLYVTGHPLDDSKEAIAKFTTLDSSAFGRNSDEAEELAGAVAAAGQSVPITIRDDMRVIMAGIVMEKRNKMTRNNETMSFVQLEDLSGSYEMIVFPSVYRNNVNLLFEGSTILVGGHLSVREDEAPKLIAEQISALSSDLRQLPDSMRGIISNGRRAYHDTDKSASRVNQKNAGHAHVNFNNAGGQQMTNISTRIINRPVVIRYNGLADDAGYNRLTSMLQYFQGDCPVKIFLPAQNRLIDLAPDFWIQPDNAVLQELALRYGARNISLL